MVSAPIFVTMNPHTPAPLEASAERSRFLFVSLSLPTSQRKMAFPFCLSLPDIGEGTLHIALGSKRSRGQGLGACSFLRGLLVQFPVNEVLLTTLKKIQLVSE